MRLCLILMIAVVGCTVNGETPTEAFNRIRQHAQNGELEELWDRLDNRTQQAVADSLTLPRAQEQNREGAKDWQNLSAKERFIEFSKRGNVPFADWKRHEILNVKSEWNAAELTVKVVARKEASYTLVIRMVREDGVWKWSPYLLKDAPTNLNSNFEP